MRDRSEPGLNRRSTGSSDPGFDQNGQPATFEASAGGFDWGTTGLAFAVGLAVLALSLAVLHAANRRGRHVAAC